MVPNQSLLTAKGAIVIKLMAPEMDGKIMTYIFAYDPKMKKRVVHVIKNGIAISLLSGNRFRYRPG